MSWEICDTGCASAEENMRVDAAWLEGLSQRKDAILHFYEWEKDSATYGHFIDPGRWLSLEKAHALDLTLARRPTGGGIVFHLWDLAFSVLVPIHHPQFSQNTLENYDYVNRAVLATLQEFPGLQALELIPVDGDERSAICRNFCMAKPTKYDVMWKGQKVAGAAQRKTREGFLHQGTISLLTPDFDYLQKVLHPGTGVVEAMQQAAYPMQAVDRKSSQFQEIKHHVRSLLATHLTHAPVEL